jgi:hypothetical protein
VALRVQKARRPHVLAARDGLTDLEVSRRLLVRRARMPGVEPAEIAGKPRRVDDPGEVTEAAIVCGQREQLVDERGRLVAATFVEPDPGQYDEGRAHVLRVSDRASGEERALGFGRGR